MARRPKLTILVHETFYGEAEVRGKDTVLWVLLGPGAPGEWKQVRAPDGETQILMKPEKQEFKLVIKGWQIPMPGFAVVSTKRWVIVDKERYLDQPVKWAEINAGPPEVTERITFNPDENQGGKWMGEAYEEWPVKLIRVRRKSRWDVMRGRLGPERRTPRG
jgi:hypothetical protein